jgi:hypothetical protein
MKNERDDKRPEDNAAGPTRSLDGSLIVPDAQIGKDGSRFLMVEWLPDQAPPVTHLKVIVNWFDELKTKIPTEDSETP